MDEKIGTHDGHDIDILLNKSKLGYRVIYLTFDEWINGCTFVKTS